MENGWYEGDQAAKLGALDALLFRARRLVVDTGLHAKRWTTQQAIDYGIRENEVERYIAARKVKKFEVIELWAVLR